MESIIINKTQNQISNLSIEKALEFYIKAFKSHSKVIGADVRIQREFCSLNLILVFVSKSEMRSLNFKYRSKDSVTDVLSFEPVEEDCLGELVFCNEQIIQQSIEHGLSFDLELSYMLLHGVLHLLGFVHEDCEREAAIMFGIQDSVFEDFKIASGNSR